MVVVVAVAEVEAKEVVDLFFLELLTETVILLPFAAMAVALVVIWVASVRSRIWFRLAPIVRTLADHEHVKSVISHVPSFRQSAMDVRAVVRPASNLVFSELSLQYSVSDVNFMAMATFRDFGAVSSEKYILYVNC